MENGKRYVVVLPHTWVVTGIVENGEQGWLTLENAAVVRRWGTSAGLGELASKGPQRETVLDVQPTTSIPSKSVCFAILCDSKAWGD
jgi:hypothetical protein